MLHYEQGKMHQWSPIGQVREVHLALRNLQWVDKRALCWLATQPSHWHLGDLEQFAPSWAVIKEDRDWITSNRLPQIHAGSPHLLQGKRFDLIEGVMVAGRT